MKRLMKPWSAAVLGATALLLVLAPPARAQTPPPSSGGGSPMEGGGSLMEKVIPADLCPRSPAGSAPASGGPRFAVSAYTIDYDEGGFTAVSRKAVGTLTEMTFATVRWVVSVGMWLVEWAFSFGFADKLAAPMSAVAGRYRVAFFVPLVGSALMISAAYAGVQIFRGRSGRPGSSPVRSPPWR